MLEIDKLIKIYPGPVPAIEGVDLEIGEGMFGLLGPNGAGKSTLMRILAGILEPSSGSVHLDGIDIVADPQQVWARLGYLPQDFGFFPHLSGEAMLQYLLELKGVTATGGIHRLVGQLLEQVNLSFAAKRKMSEYSGGMRQRLGIAQAISGNPRLVIVDEPTAGLDPEERIRFYRLLAELATDRIVLLSTHIVEDVATLCPRFAVMRSGRLLTVTTPEDSIRSLVGTIYEGTIDKSELDKFYQNHRVTQAILVAGQNRVRIQVDTEPPPPGFEVAEPSLADAYLLQVRRNNRHHEHNDPSPAETGANGAATA